MSIGTDGTWPATSPIRVATFWCRPNSQVVVKEVGQVVLYEIFPRNPKVKRIPVIKFTLQLPMNIHITRLPQKYITTHTHT